MQWLQVGILAGRALRERQCTLEGEVCYLNVWGSVPYCVCKFFLIDCKIDQSEKTKSHMFNMSLRLTNQK